MESSAADRSHHRVPLSEVVSDCVKRWFQDTLREAKSGDVSMQVLVGQMYYSGYGVPRDAQKVYIFRYLLLVLNFFFIYFLFLWDLLLQIVGFVVLENFVFCPLPEKPREKKNEILNLIFHLVIRVFDIIYLVVRNDLRRK